MQLTVVYPPGRRSARVIVALYESIIVDALRRNVAHTKHHLDSVR